MHPLIEPYHQEITALCQRHAVQRLELFGSALRDDFDPARSDLDFLVEFDPDTDANLFEAYFDLRRELAELLGRPVDLVMPSAIRNPYRRASIEANRELIYAACQRRGLPYWKSAGNFVLIDVRRLGQPADVVRIFAERGILVRDRSRDAGCQGCIRVTAGVVRHTAMAVEVLEALCAEL